MLFRGPVRCCSHSQQQTHPRSQKVRISGSLSITLFFLCDFCGCLYLWLLLKLNLVVKHNLLSMFPFPRWTLFLSFSFIPLSLAGWRQSWRSCRTVAGQQIPLCFLHPAGIQPHPGNTMVQSCNFMTPTSCVYSFFWALSYLIINALYGLENQTKKPTRPQISREVA